MIKTEPPQEVETCYIQGHYCLPKFAEWEGLIVGVANDRHFIVEMFSAWDGSPTHRELVSVDRMAAEEWRFFASAESRDSWIERNRKRCEKEWERRKQCRWDDLTRELQEELAVFRLASRGHDRLSPRESLSIERISRIQKMLGGGE